MIEIFVTIELTNNRVISDYVKAFYNNRELESVEYESQDITKLLTPYSLSRVQEELDEALRSESGCGNDIHDR